MASKNIVIGWLKACSAHHRRRLALRLGLGDPGDKTTRGRSLDALAAGLLAECAGDLKMRPDELATIVGDPRRVGREAVLELALVGLDSSSRG
ncbi:MAG: hypothetical protein VX527_05495 [Planctomycetota bacterium]|nr:hypothetical protein [Planctomycetota bacterium]